MYPYSCHTHLVKAKFAFEPFGSHQVCTGIRKVDNPWRDYTEWGSAPVTHHNYSARDIENVDNFKIIEQNTYTFILRGLRDGQQYAA